LIGAVEMPERVLQLVAAVAGAAVGAQVLEERVGGVDPAAAVENTCTVPKSSANVDVVVTACEVSSKEPSSGGGSQAGAARAQGAGDEEFPRRGLHERTS
jgi:hypothetical protein